MNSEDENPLSWKMTKQRVFFTAWFPSKAGKTHESRSSSEKLMEDALVARKHYTQKRKSMKKKTVIEIELPIEEVVLVEESEEIESDQESDNDFDANVDADFYDEVNKDVVRSVDSRRAKSKGVFVVSPNKGKAKGVLIKKPVSIGVGKKKDKAPSSKGLGPNSKTARTSKEPGVSVKGTGPSGKASHQKEREKPLQENKDKRSSKHNKC